MRIALVTHGLPPERRGGVQVYSAALAKALARGHQVGLLVVQPPPARDPVRVADGSFAGMPYRWIFARRRPEDCADLRPPEIRGAVEEFFDRFRPEVVHHQHLCGAGLVAFDAAERRGIPQFWTLHDYWAICLRTKLQRPDESNCVGPEAEGCAACRADQGGTRDSFVDAIGPVLRAVLLARAAERMAGLFATSRHLRARLLAQNPVWESAREISYPLPHPFARQVPSAPRPPRTLVAGALCNLYPHKGVHVLLEAAAGLEGVEVRIFGSGPEEYLRRLRAIHPGAVFGGPYAPERLGGILGALDVLVIPSVWEEIFGIVALEAFHAGIPVVASDIGGLREAVREGEGGVRFPPGDAGALRAILERLRDDPAERARLAGSRPGTPDLAAHAEEMAAAYRAAAR